MSGALRDLMAAVTDAIEAELDRLLPAATGPQARLHEAMRYAVLGGGKRLRPMLVRASADLFGVAPGAATRVGAAVELIHAYSLIHDDLPSMDDAALRRGRPSCHRAFDEATAILAGDALQPLAFEVLARGDYGVDPALRCELVLGLARAAGAGGMCGGQMIDLQAERQRLTLDEITLLQGLKTGALIGFACDAGAILGRRAGMRSGRRWRTMRATSGSRSRSRTISWTGWATVPSPARMPGATRMSARPRSSASWARLGRWRSWPSCAHARPPALTSSVHAARSWDKCSHS